MNAAVQRDLTDLRTAAQRRDQEQLQFLTKRLLQQLDHYAALAVVLERLYSFLDLFESYYPQEDWIRRLLVGVAAFGMSPDDGVAEMALQQQFTAAGCANYLKAIYDLTQAMNKKHAHESRVGYMTSAIVNTIMAELAEAWYGARPEAWERVRTNAYEQDPEVALIAYGFWMDEQTAALDTACWLEVATSLEKSLQRQG